MESLLLGIENSAVGTAIRQSTWLFPTIETVHVAALVLVISAIGVVDLRLAGLTLRERGVDELMRAVLPGAWVSFVAAAITGAALFAGNAVSYAGNPAFQLKALFLLLAGANMAVFHLGAHKRLAHWDPEGLPPLAARAAGAVSLLLWVGVVFAGRWIGFAA
jgi:hypothetical protein